MREYAEVRNVLLASRDPVALDATIAARFGLDPLQNVAWMREAHRQGSGVADLRTISIYGNVEALSDQWGLATPSPCRAPRRFRRWTTADTMTMASWLRDTGWGRLFRDYQRRYAAPA
jgi:hypothetical protein